MKIFIRTILMAISVIAIISCDSRNSLVELEKIIYPYRKATSNGESWQLLQSLPTVWGVAAIRLTGLSCDYSNNLYVSTSGGGIFSLNLQDKSYYQFSPYEFDYRYVSSLAGAVLYSDNRIITGFSNLSNNGGIYISEDKQTFECKVLWQQRAYLVSLFKTPNGKIIAGCLFGGYSSDDNGNTWSFAVDRSDSSYGYFYSFAADKCGNIYSATCNGVYYSDSDKIYFRSLGLGRVFLHGIDINSKGWIYVSTQACEMYCSKDYGSSWQKLSGYPHLQAASVYINQNDYVFAGTENGIYRSKDDGVTWELVGMAGKSIEMIVSDSKGGLIAGTYYNQIYYSSQ